MQAGLDMRGEPFIDEKSAVNLRIRASLKARARELGLNLSQTLEASLEREIQRHERAAWQEQNRRAVEAYNQRIEERGPTLSAFRSF
ncbi:MAG: type II toxin-antitoxin system CcdA family antitoxin [Xanthomonadales bacterium]|nr:type II toxin-antitoxin system CcdA family antitoxin [Xanthomonadales bacterium]